MEDYVINRESLSLKVGAVTEIKLPREVALQRTFCRIETEHQLPVKLGVMAYSSALEDKTVGSSWKITIPITRFDLASVKQTPDEAVTAFDRIEITSEEDVDIILSVIEDNTMGVES